MGKREGEEVCRSYLVELIARLLMFRYLSISEFLVLQEREGSFGIIMRDNASLNRS